MDGIKHDGVWLSDPQKIKDAFQVSFESKFKKKSVDKIEVRSAFYRSIQDSQNLFLISPVSEGEIHTAICDCEFFSSSIMPKGCNTSFIALIPKISNPLVVSDYRPISLIGAQYKIIAKLLANRLARVIDSVISCEQTAFVKHRQILDGPLMVNEVIKWCNRKRDKLMIFKIDFEKAFDSISWDYVLQIMKFMGFHGSWISWIRGCLNHATSSVLVNGSPTNEFHLSRGLRQGDPLSPFLFIIAMEGLHVAIEDAIAAGLYRGITMHTLSLSHFFFADDALFVGEWSRENIRNLSIILECFHRVSGLKINFHKSNLVCRDPRWGRCYEGYSEDTELVRKMTSLVTGLQGTPPPDHPSGYPYVAGRNNVMACAKHFVGDGGTDKGKNEGNTIISYEELENIHMLPYSDCISKGVCTVMASYSSWNGTKMHSHRHLLTDILKEKLGFKANWEALDRFYDPHGSNYRSAVLSAVNAGVDMVMVPFRYQLFLEDLGYLVESGEVPMSRIDDAVERILRVKFAAGLFEYPMADRSLLDIVGCKQHRELAREAVRKSLVLLKNGKDSNKTFLPLDRNAKRVLVAGKHADDLGYQCGGWTATWDGTSGRITTGTTILDAVKEAIGENTEVVYEENPTIDSLSAQDFSYAIVVVGEAPYVESGGDNSELTIPFNGNELLKLVADKIPTLGILISGRPLVLEPSVLETLDALVAAWLPGTEGNGITDVIFGDYEFHGRLPVSWFKTVDQLPMNTHQDSYDPLFPLGYGLKSKA
ncbi:beta-glucosidase BoGH3B-like protein [Tanacetum coccineum]